MQDAVKAVAGQTEVTPSATKTSVRWTPEETLQLLNACKQVPLTERSTQAAVATYLLQNGLKGSERTDYGVRHRLQLLALPMNYTNADLQNLISTSPYVSPQPVLSLAAVRSRFDYLNAEKVFRLNGAGLGDNARAHICLLWKQIPAAVTDLNERLDRFVSMTHYSAESLIAMLTEQAIRYQSQ
ncbi:hypothetical protein [Parendozoicomonas haliclonae]|uniref:hypothetical protein n=1 Tax=Parendozoicomonas haliclonae TaxID=1960125 RepID=UPI0039EF586A